MWKKTNGFKSSPTANFIRRWVEEPHRSIARIKESSYENYGYSSIRLATFDWSNSHWKISTAQMEAKLSNTRVVYIIVPKFNKITDWWLKK